jgi:mannose-6-phosphate isomerase-like protein (cupin superfamily)
MNTTPTSVIVQPGEGKELRAFGHVLSVFLAGEQTGGALAVMFGETPPGGGAPLHVHSREDEWFLVVEGRISFFADGRWTEVEPGGAVYLPRGCPHTYRNSGTIPSKHWVHTAPAGFEKFFARCADEFAKPGEPDMSRIVEVFHEHGIELLGEPPA